MRLTWKQIFTSIIFYPNVMHSTEIRITETYCTVTELRKVFSEPLAISTVCRQAPVRFTWKQLFTSLIFYRNVQHNTEIRTTKTECTVTELEWYFSGPLAISTVCLQAPVKFP